ncbi:MAG TPA: tetratricopeptide repeat protein, partial [Rhodocyclaceae bacterium]|nr:tetratricopeptide repeat protein [Rhodocyclaceae bacterium]
AQGDGPAALTAYRAGLAIRETLARRDPANTQWQRDLSVSHERIGDVLRAQGDGPAALDAYRAGLAIAETLARRDPANTQWQHDLSVSHTKIGDVLVAQGDGPAALKAYRKSLTIAETLARRDSGNAQWQVDLAVSYGMLGTTSALPVAERRAFLLRGREIQQRLKAAGRLVPAQDQIATFNAELAKLPAAD